MTSILIPLMWAAVAMFLIFGMVAVLGKEKK